MFHPFFTLEGHDPLEGSQDSWAAYSDQFISSDMGEGGGIEDFLARYTVYPENVLDSYLLSGSCAPMNELHNGPAPVEPDLESSLMSEFSSVIQPKGESLPAPFASSGIPNNHRPSCNRLNRKWIRVEGERRELLTEEVMKVASALFIQTSAFVAGNPTNLRLPFGLSVSSLKGEELKSVELVCLLLAAAEKVSNEYYNLAIAMLRQCAILSSKSGNAAQRVVYYFSNALKERIDRENGKLPPKGQKEMGTMTPQDAVKAVLMNHPVQLISHNTLPFAQVLQFTAIQTLLDKVASAKRIHIIDLSIKYGQQWTVFLQGLATRCAHPIESVTISAVGAVEDLITMTGKRLSSFAESLSLPFKFKQVTVPDMKELREDMFELEEGETAGVYSSLDMNNLILKPESLDNLMKVLQKVKPCLMTVIDVEANHNSSSFINRFTEALFFYSAYFDCHDSLMEERDENRLTIEGFFSQGIKSTIACEGSERVVRPVGVSVWRAFFRRFGLREADLSKWSMYQAGIIIKQFVEDNSCTLEMNRKAMLTGWKGTPLHFVSAWELLQEKEVSAVSHHLG